MSEKDFENMRVSQAAQEATCRATHEEQRRINTSLDERLKRLEQHVLILATSGSLLGSLAGRFLF